MIAFGILAVITTILAGFFCYKWQMEKISHQYDLEFAQEDAKFWHDLLMENLHATHLENIARGHIPVPPPINLLKESK